MTPWRRSGGRHGAIVFRKGESLAEMGSPDDPCLVLAAGGQPPEDGGVTAAARDTGGKIVAGAERGVRKLGDGLKNLFED